MDKFTIEVCKNQCVEWIRDWFDKNGKDCNAVVGISGGKDSSVVAALCVEALGKDRVFGVYMPKGNKVDTDLQDVTKLCRHLGIEWTIIDILGTYLNLEVEIRGGIGAFSEQTKINLSPRIRMATLYAISQSINGRVACTDNRSESFIGYSTRWGDNVGDFSPLAGLTSDEVVAIGDLLGLPYELTHKTPADGLCGKSDEDNFGFTYEILNKYIRTGICEDEEVKGKIDYLHNKNRFKLEPIPFYAPPATDKRFED